MTARRKETKIAYSFIRFSSKRQELNSSVRRQTKITEDYAKEKGLILDKKTRLFALKVSGHTGDHIAKGSALGGFLEAAKQNQIPAGTALLVEKIDRLSRLKPMDAVTLFLDILRCGIEIHTIGDRQVFTEDNVNSDISRLHISIGGLFTAHRYSADLGERVAFAWGEKREAARNGEIATAKLPYWLKAEGRRMVNGRMRGGNIVQIPERVAVVRLIFELRKLGLGKHLIKGALNGERKVRIARELNVQRTPPFGRSKVWNDSSVQAILHNPACIGIYQPHRSMNKRRKPIGDPIENYFPAIIDRDTFNLCQVKSEVKRGRVSDRVSNLFTGLLFDGYTGAKMIYSDKGVKKGDKYRYLYSDAPRLQNGARTCGWKYSDFEAHFLDYVAKINWKNVATKAQSLASSELRKKLHAAAEELVSLQAQDKNFAATTVMGSISKAAVELNNKVVQRLEKLEAEIKVLRQKLAGTKKDTMTGAEIKRLVKQGDFTSRHRLRVELYEQIERVELFPNGYRHKEKGMKFEYTNPTFLVRFKSASRQVIRCEGKLTFVVITAG